MELNGQPGAALTASPLLSSKYVDPYCVFRVSLPPHHEIAQWVPFIVGLRARRFCKAKVCSNWTHETESGPHHVARNLARMVGLSFASWHSMLTFSHVP
jgi:hypothetical protein